MLRQRQFSIIHLIVEQRHNIREGMSLLYKKRLMSLMNDKCLQRFCSNPAVFNPRTTFLNFNGQISFYIFKDAVSSLLKQN